MTEICPICKGEGKRILILKHHVTGGPYTAIDWCLCMKSRLISQAPNYRILIGLGDEYMPLDKADSRLKFDQNNLPECPNLLISAETSYDSFCMNVKAVIMAHHFNYPAPLIHACDAMDILKNFYVEQDDKTCRSLADVNKYDLLVFTIGTDEKNLQLKTCIAQVVHNRTNIKKPTWIYIKKPTLTACIQEYSEDLEKYLANYKRIDLAEVGPVKLKHSQSKKAAERGIF